jgi:hypothetical protein
VLSWGGGGGGGGGIGREKLMRSRLLLCGLLWQTTNYERSEVSSTQFDAIVTGTRPVDKEINRNKDGGYLKKEPFPVKERRKPTRR